MSPATEPKTSIFLPVELLAKMEELKNDRDDDRGKTVEEIIQALCNSYINVRQRGREEAVMRTTRTVLPR